MPTAERPSWVEAHRLAEPLAKRAQLRRLLGNLPSYFKGPAYEVGLDCAPIGVVYRTTRETSRKVGRLRYNVRQRPCWGVESRGWYSSFLTYDTRQEAVVALFAGWLQSRPEGA